MVFMDVYGYSSGIVPCSQLWVRPRTGGNALDRAPPHIQALALQAPFQQLSASNTSGRIHGWRAVTMEAAYGSGQGDLSRRKNCRDPLQMLGLKVQFDICCSFCSFSPSRSIHEWWLPHCCMMLYDAVCNLLLSSEEIIRNGTLGPSRVG